MKISVSVLAADFRRLEFDIHRIEDAGADSIHLDIMDGHFVPNLGIGFSAAEAVARVTRLPLEAHLMIRKPQDYWRRFADLGAQTITAHVETLPDPGEFMDTLRANNISPGLAIKPKTALETLWGHIQKTDFILQMTVEPGFYGQSFLPEVLPRLDILKEALASSKGDQYIQVDGGINAQTIRSMGRAGVQSCVVGSAAFKGKDMPRLISMLRREASQDPGRKDAPEV